MPVPIPTSSSWRAPTLSPIEGLDRAIERAQAYVAAGADMIFAEAVTELSMYTAFRKAVGVPILANITEFGKTPLFTRDELAERRRRHHSVLLRGLSRHECRGAQGVSKPSAPRARKKAFCR